MVPVSLVRSSVGPDSGPDANLVLSVIRIFVRTKTGQIPEPDQIKAIFGPVQISQVMKNPEWSGLSARTGPVPKYLRNQWPDQNLDENFGSDRTWTNEILEFVDRFWSIWTRSADLCSTLQLKMKHLYTFLECGDGSYYEVRGHLWTVAEIVNSRFGCQ